RPPSSTLFPYTTLFRSVLRAEFTGDPDECPEARRHSWPEERREEIHDGSWRGSARGGSALRPARLAEPGPAPRHRSHHADGRDRSEEHTSELQSLAYLV